MDELWNELYQDYYKVFDQLRKVKIDSRQIYKDYGKYASFQLNSICPIVIKRGGLPLDVLAENLGFESADLFYQHIESYQPKYKTKRKLKEEKEEYYGCQQENY